MYSVASCTFNGLQVLPDLMKNSPDPHPMLLMETMHGKYEKSKEHWRRDENWEEAFSKVTEKELKSFEALFSNAKRKLLDSCV